MENYPYENETSQFMASLNKDLGCLKTLKVERSELSTTELSSISGEQRK